MVSYYFSWGMAVSVSLVLAIISVFQKKYSVVKKIGLSVVLGFTLLLPYWLSLLQNTKTSDGHTQGIAKLKRFGLFLTHEPVFNKVLLLGTVFFLLFFVYERYFKKIAWRDIKPWWWFCVALLGGSFWAYNQQVITGYSLWHHHFVQFSTPIVVIVFFLLLFNVVRLKYRNLWLAVILGLSILSIVNAAVTVKSFVYRLEDFRHIQSYAQALNWLESNAPTDCVVYSGKFDVSFNTLVPAFTHCNTYLAQQLFTGSVPMERVYHNYFVLLGMQGVSKEESESYMYDHPRELRGYFYEDWSQLLGKQSGSNEGEWFTLTVKDVAEKYATFLDHDFNEELRKYHLDYIALNDKMSDELVKKVKGVSLVDNLNGVYLYKIE
jgi:hypothetical protein